MADNKEIKISLTVDGIKQALDSASKYGKSLNELKTSAKQLKKQLEDATDPEDIARLNTEFEEVQGSIISLSNTITGSLTTSVKAFNLQISQIVDEAEASEEALSKLFDPAITSVATDGATRSLKDIKVLSGEYKRQSKILDELKKRYKDLALAEGTTSKEARALFKVITDMDKKMKDLDETLGDGRRSVGLYGKAISGLRLNIKNTASSIKQGIANAATQWAIELGKMATATDDFRENSSKNFSELGGVWSGFISGLAKTLSALVNVLGVTINIWKVAISVIKGLQQAATGDFSKAWDTVSTQFSKSINDSIESITLAFNDLTEIPDAFGTAYEKGKKATEALTDANIDLKKQLASLDIQISNLQLTYKRLNELQDQDNLSIEERDRLSRESIKVYKTLEPLLARRAELVKKIGEADVLVLESQGKEADALAKRAEVEKEYNSQLEEIFVTRNDNAEKSAKAQLDLFESFADSYQRFGDAASAVEIKLSENTKRTFTQRKKSIEDAERINRETFDRIIEKAGELDTKLREQRFSSLGLDFQKLSKGPIADATKEIQKLADQGKITQQEVEGLINSLTSRPDLSIENLLSMDEEQLANYLNGIGLAERLVIELIRSVEAIKKSQAATSEASKKVDLDLLTTLELQKQNNQEIEKLELRKRDGFIETYKTRKNLLDLEIKQISSNLDIEKERLSTLQLGSLAYEEQLKVVLDLENQLFDKQAENDANRRERLIAGIQLSLDLFSTYSSQIFDLASQYFQQQEEQIKARIDIITNLIQDSEKKISEIQSEQSKVYNELERLEESLSSLRSENTQKAIEDISRLKGEQEVLAQQEAAESQKKAELLRKEDKLKAELAKKEKQRRQIEKAQAISDAIIDGASAVMQITATYAALPVLQAVLIAATAAITSAQVALISSQKFQKGGLIQGPTHGQGGVPFAVGGRVGFEAEGGEFIVNRNSSQRFMPVLEAINNQQNLTPQLQPMNQSIKIDDSRLVRAMLEVANRPSYVSVKEINEVENRLTVIEDLSRL